MSFAALKKQVLAQLSEGLVAEGFDKKIVGQTFSRSFHEGKHALHVSFVPHQISFDFTLDAALRYDKAERLIFEFDISQGNKPIANAFTMGVELGNLTEGQPHRFNISMDSDLPSLVSDALAFFKQAGLPYLEKYSVPEIAIDILSGDEKSSWLQSPLHSKRAISAVAMTLAYVGKPSALALAEKQDALLESRGDFGVKRFREFVDYLTATA
jgi:hypothetical protein